MRFIFSAPFRTQINLDSISAVDSLDMITDILTETNKYLMNNFTEGIVLSSPWCSDSNSCLQYSSLSEDNLPLTAKPLIKMNITGLARSFEYYDISEDYDSGLSLINESYVEFYDNTIAVLLVDITFKNIINKNAFISSLDQWSTKYCSALINSIKLYEKKIQEKLIELDLSYKTKHFVPNGSFKVFFDRNQTFTNINDEMLWVTRICLEVKPNSNLDIFFNWTANPDLLEKKVKLLSSSATFCVGNSLTFGKLNASEESALKVSLSLSLYFYVLHSTLNKNLRTIFLDISNSKKVSNSVITNINRITSHIEFIENEFSDVIMGLQGLRCKITNILLDTWNYSELIRSVQKKKNAVEKNINFILQEKNNKYRRIVESILAGIGGISILDFSLNLFLFSSKKIVSNDSIPGLIDATNYLSVDGTIYMILLFLFFVFFLIMKKR
ncbi:hypothetical protein [Pseudoalteromonas distincta]|uniref:hypothetical protein n=1 Tax=Pseudoalteromonas distincta TaxID=77608 RepID=UPI0011F185D1|nr:hypothetical protein [Pseudoalteromonas distincta]KAA1161559.1 hypothetical protein EU511_08465 [Pseudoalteromonas distincta]